MRLTTKGRFAVTAMIDLALRQDKGQLRCRELVKDKVSHCHIWNSCSAGCANMSWSVRAEDLEVVTG